MTLETNENTAGQTEESVPRDSGWDRLISPIIGLNLEAVADSVEINGDRMHFDPGNWYLKSEPEEGVDLFAMTPARQVRLAVSPSPAGGIDLVRYEQATYVQDVTSVSAAGGNIPPVAEHYMAAYQRLHLPIKLDEFIIRLKQSRKARAHLFQDAVVRQGDSIMVADRMVVKPGNTQAETLQYHDIVSFSFPVREIVRAMSVRVNRGPDLDIMHIIWLDGAERTLGTSYLNRNIHLEDLSDSGASMGTKENIRIVRGIAATEFNFDIFAEPAKLAVGLAGKETSVIKNGIPNRI